MENGILIIECVTYGDWDLDGEEVLSEEESYDVVGAASSAQEAARLISGYADSRPWAREAKDGAPQLDALSGFRVTQVVPGLPLEEGRKSVHVGGDLTYDGVLRALLDL
jgi:hypothetical protein